MSVLSHLLLAGLDIEGDGNSPIEPIETAIVGPDGSECVFMSNPGRPISPHAVAVHGLTDADLVNAPAFDVHAPAIGGLLSGVVVVGHGLTGDMAILKRKIPNLVVVGKIDTLTVARRCMERKVGLRLHNLAAELSVELPHVCGPRGAHSALYDAKLALNLLERLAGMFPAAVSEHLRDSGLAPRLAWSSAPQLF